LAKPAMAAAPAYETGDGEPVKIDAPFGYYESVFWHDACGKKHLYGWRYIGFMPFNSCPVQACPNIHDAHCDDPDQFWALIPTSGASLQFIRIGDLKSGKGQSSRNIIPDTESAPPPPADAPATAPAPKPAANRRHVEDEVGVGIRPARHSRTRVQLGPASARGQGEPIMRQ